jgi:class 3 adenylate cyclase/tetratricopeptide (TPR) repeat protein
MRCPTCGFENPEGMKFCGQCASPLGRRCPQCGFDNPPGFAFCGQCATPLTEQPPALQPQAPRSYTPSHLAEKILTSKTALEGERKQVTVLFADLKGSMELLADRDPEDARALLDPVLTLLMDAVHRYEGTVNQVMGDGIMALFGAPIAHEDHAVRASYAALAMQASVKQYAEDVQRTRGVPLHIRVGLNSGEVIVRTIGSDLRMDYTAVGQTTHLAARMEQTALPGTILLAPDTWRLAEGYVQVRALGPIPLKGLAAPVEVYEVVGAGLTRTRLQAAAARGLTRFVGRDAEVEVLRQSLGRAGAGHGQIVALVGEPGVGKSRLAYEFLHSHHTQGWRVLESSSVSYGKATAYLPVRDLLKAYCHLEDRDDLRTVRAKITGHILTLDDTLQETVPAVLALFEALPADHPFLSLDPLPRRRRTLEALKRLLLRESRVQPLLLVFEDLHWIDSETQAVLDLLVESLPTAHVLLLVNYRPEYQHSWGSKTAYAQIRLDPLPEASADELLQALLGSDGGAAVQSPLQDLKHRLIARSQGNPFFLEESVRTLVETGVLIGDRGAYHLAQPLDTWQVPPTVQALLAARIDRLLPEDKRLLQTAAVIGTDVPLPLLQAIAEVPEASLHRGLARLQTAEFLYETRLFPEREYTFKHALTHEVAYSSQLQTRRRALHTRIVEALEARSPDRLTEHVDQLAHHAWQAAQWDKAVTYGRQAGDKAADRAGFPEAATAFERAIEALAHLPTTPDTGRLAIELRRDLADVLLPLGEHGRSLALLGEAESLARQLDDQAQLGQVLAMLAAVRRMQGDLAGAIAAGRQALEVAVALGDRTLQAVTALRLGQAYYAVGDAGRAAALLRQNVTALEPGTAEPDPYDRIASRAWLALVLSARGEFAEGARHGEEALRLAVADGRGATPVVAYGCLGLLYLNKGDLEAAVRVLSQGLARCRATGNRDWSRPIAAGLGYAQALAGRLAEGRVLLEEALKEGLHTGALQAQALHVAWLSEVCLRAGRRQEAWQHAHHALALARQQQARGNEGQALRALGTIHADANPPDTERAEAYYRQALTLASELGLRPRLAHGHFDLGRLYAKVGRRAQAGAELSVAVDLYRTMAMTFWLPQAEAALAQVEGR